MYNAHCVHQAGASLGESPLWNPKENQLYWVDINNRRIHRFDPDTKHTVSWSCHTEIGCIGLADHGRLIAGLRDGFYYFTPSTGVLDHIVDPEPDKPLNRLNDGKVDRAGRLWCGSMQDPNPDDPSGALYRLDKSGKYARLLEGIRIPNAIAWSPDNKIMYFTDTRESAIWAFDFNFEVGEISNKRIFVDLSGQRGRPDGATVDAEGYLWNAEYGGSRVVRYSPDGKFDRQLDMPVTNVTCCALGGPGLTTLFITTAAQKLDDSELADQPQAGGLFACDVGIKGLPEPLFVDRD